MSGGTNFLLFLAIAGPAMLLARWLNQRQGRTGRRDNGGDGGSGWYGGGADGGSDCGGGDGGGCD